MGIIYKVQNTGTVPYNGFTFTDANSVVKVIDLQPLLTYYVDGNSVISPSALVTVLYMDKTQTKYCFQSCCGTYVFSFNGVGTIETFGNYSLGDVINFGQAISSANPTEIRSGCFELISSGVTGTYSCGLIDNNYTTVSIDSSYTKCSDCLTDVSCCTQYQVTNQSSIGLVNKIEFTPCCDETKTSPYTIPFQTAISFCSSSGVKVLKGDVQVDNVGDCPSCGVITTTTNPYVTTTTTLSPPIPPITPRNECDVLTIFPLGVQCFTIDPTTDSSFDGTITLGITGGTPPYEIVWETGSLAQSITNLGFGEYNSVVTDFYGDFTAYTTCVLGIPPILTTTTTKIPVPNPNYLDLCITVIRGSKVYSYVEYYQFTFNGYIGNYPTWNDSVNNFDIIWNTTTNQWEVDGWLVGQLITTNPATPPLSGWDSLGSTLPNRVLSVIANIGDCDQFTLPEFNLNINNPTCDCNGSIIFSPFGGNPPYTYSIDGGNSYVSSPVFNNLCSGQFVCHIMDISGNTTTQVATLASAPQLVTYSLLLSYTGPNSFTVTVSPALPNGVVVTFDFIHKNSFIVGPYLFSATFSNIVTVNVNGIPISITVYNPPIFYPPTPILNCLGANEYQIDKQFNWINVNMSNTTTITGTYTYAINPVLPLPKCYVAIGTKTLMIANPRINCECCAIIALNPKD